MVGLVLLLLTLACAQAPTAGVPTHAPSPTQVEMPKLPPPSDHPQYPPANLADLSALASRGMERSFIVGEGQHLSRCSRAWDEVYEPAGTAPRQMAADLLKVAIDRRVLLTSCGGFIFGTTDRKFCNCYHGDHGYVVIERGPEGAPTPGKMRIYFSVDDNKVSPDDWQVTVEQVDI